MVMKSIFSIICQLVYGLIALYVAFLVFEPLSWLGVTTVFSVYALVFFIWALKTARVFDRASGNGKQRSPAENPAENPAATDMQVLLVNADKDPTKETTDYVALLDQKNKH